MDLMIAAFAFVVGLSLGQIHSRNSVDRAVAVAEEWRKLCLEFRCLARIHEIEANANDK